MPATPITNPFPGEDLLGIDPQFLQQVNAGWRHRLALFTGRALSDTALDNEQVYRAGLLATLGQAVTPGVVKGLVVSFDISGAATTTTAAVAAASNVSVPVVSSAGFQTGQQVVIDTGSNQEQFQVTAVPDPTHVVAATLSKAHNAGVSVQFEPLMNPAAGTGAATTITAAIAGAGQNITIAVGDSTGFQTGQPAVIDAGANQEQFNVVAIPDATHIVVDALANGHAAGAAVVFEPGLHVTAGYGIAASGEDVYLLRDLHTKFGALAVIDLVTGETQQSFADYIESSGSTSFAGILLLQPVLVQATAKTLGTGSSPVIVSGNLDASCDQDPDETAFADLQVVDATRLVFVPWPAALPLPPQMPLETWRNRLAYTIFNAELALQEDDQLPWTMLGVPVAVAGFDSSWKPLFVDCGAVARAGGLPRRSYVLPVGADEAPSLVEPALLQARISQFAEQLSERLTSTTPLGNLSDLFSSAPPSGIVPAGALDFVARKNRWFPPNWVLTAGPVHLEELETALQTGITAAPLAVAATAPTDPTQLEPVEILVPLPDELYDPNILITETVSGDFQAEIDLATSARNLTLRKRKAIQLETNALITALGPNVPGPNPNLINLNAGLAADEIAGRDTALPYFPQSSSNPAEDESFGALSPATWQPNAGYIVGQFIVDPNRNIQVVQTPGGSASAQPTWGTVFGAVTADGSSPSNLKWINNGPVTLGSAVWQPASAYLAGKPGAPLTPGFFIIDSNGNIQTVQTAGISGTVAPAWGTNAGAITSDGTVRWVCQGLGTWKPNTSYSVGQFIVDPKGNIQTVQTAGTSASTQPWWSLGKPTVDGGLTWIGVRPQTWQNATPYQLGQWVLDSNGNIQIVSGAGTSGPVPPNWNAQFGQPTQETAAGAATGVTVAGVRWTNTGIGVWQPNTTYVAGQFIFDRNSNVQTIQTPGKSGASEPHWGSTSGFTQDGAAIWFASSWGSADLQGVIAYPGAFTADANGLTMLKRAPAGPDDMTDLLNNGLQCFINDINARINRADDLINLAFLTAQTDIYRYRQNVLGTIDASKLATSPILANIATGDTAAVVSENLQSFLKSIPTTPAPAPAPAPAGTPATTPPASGTSGTVGIRTFRPMMLSTQLKNKVAIPAPPVQLATPAIRPVFTATAFKPVTLNLEVAASAKRFGVGVVAPPTIYRPIIRGTTALPSKSGDVTEQQPLVGAQINVRTLTIAERLAQSPSQEALFYSVSNRLAFLQLLSTLDINIADLTILVDGAPTEATDTDPHPVDTHTLSELRDATAGAKLLTQVQNVQIPANADEATMFSSGIRVLEQHSQLLRALEARVQQYRDFVSFCSTALTNIQSDLQHAQSALTQLQNNLLQERQDLAFTGQLLADEQLRVASVNAKRTQTLQNSVQVIAYTRARTLEATSDTPTRQLVPGNVTSPVPACLQQSVTIPPELREIVALLREAPVNWLPAVEALLNRLERPHLLYELAASSQVRAMVQLQLPPPASSADRETGVYAPVISNLYYANQQVFHTFATERSSFPVTQLANQSWNSMVGVLQNLAAVGDLISSAVVHAEIVNATSRIMTQISNVATCLYTRVSTTDPEYRLAWAEFLRGPGLSLQLQSLAVLPNWTQQEYVARDQMQMLVDWLFQQIDTGNSAAVAFTSDVVRVCILLASHAPVDEIITSALTVRTRPIVGGVLALNLPSERIASGMYVNLYSKGTLAAQAVVSDLDRQTVKATVTRVYQPDIYLETTDVAHFTAQIPKGLAVRAFAR